MDSITGDTEASLGETELMKSTEARLEKLVKAYKEIKR